MTKFLSDMHTHSTFSFDGKETLENMLQTAQKKSLAFYGVSEHFNYDLTSSSPAYASFFAIDEEAYFHRARHLQDDYAGCMNVYIGAEFGFSSQPRAIEKYCQIVEKYRPDYIIHSVHGVRGDDFHDLRLYTKKFELDKDADLRKENLRDKKEVYREYLQAILESLRVPYPYDIVGHMGYVTRYAPYADKRMTLNEFGKEIDEILTAIIQKDKILEVNSQNKGVDGLFVPSEEILRRYFALGGRKISFGSDAHVPERIAEKREEIVGVLREIGFTHLTIPCRGEHFQIEL